MSEQDVKRAPTRELGTSSLYPIPSWGKLTASAIIQPLEHVPELFWPLSVRQTYPRMRNDTQLSGLFRGTSLPIMRYVWGIDPNGAPADMTERVCAELGLQTIDQAWATFQTGKSEPVARSRNKFSFSAFQSDALKACYLGNYLFEQIYDVEQDGPAGRNGGWFAHLDKLAPRAPWTISQFYSDPDGSLTGVRQTWQKLGDPPIPATQLVAFVFDQDPGDWVGSSLFRPCYREWVSKDLLYRIDTVNHEKAGGVLITEAPMGAAQAEIDALGAMSANMRAGGGGAVPGGANPVFLRATGSDVIASINQRDEAMARAFLMMFMSLGTSSSGGNRALSGSFIDWFAIAQESIANWFQDVVNEHVIKDFVDLNWDNAEYIPQLVVKRPEDANPLDDLMGAATTPGAAGAPAATALVDADGKTVPVTSTRLGRPGQVVVDDNSFWALHEAHAERERDIAPDRRTRRSSSARATANDVASVPLPDRPLRREPTEMEARSAIDFKQIDDNWQTQVEGLVAEWLPIRDAQIDQLHDLILAANGDMSVLARLQALAHGTDVLTARLQAMALSGAQDAVAEADRQGVTAAIPDLAALRAELAARSAALAQLLAQSISQAASQRAFQITGGALTSTEVALQTRDYLTSLTNTYLRDQFGGALSAAQNAGRLAVMGHNNATRMYASELLDTNTCQPCEDIDGTEFSSAEEAAASYPAGGFKDCAGGPRCRGTVVAIFDEAPSNGGNQ